MLSACEMFEDTRVLHNTREITIAYSPNQNIMHFLSQILLNI